MDHRKQAIHDCDPGQDARLRAVRDMQDRVRASLPAGYTGGLADEVIADRRAEAARENAESTAWWLAKGMVR